MILDFFLSKKLIIGNTLSILVSSVITPFSSGTFISSLSNNVITDVPQILRDGHYALDAPKSNTIKKVIFPTSLPIIYGSIVLSVSIKIGETTVSYTPLQAHTTTS